MRNRAPTGADYRQPETGKLYPIDCYWIVGKDPTTGIEGDLWYLSKIVANVAYWLQLSTGSSGPLLNVIVPLGVSPIVPDGAGTMNFTSSGGTIAITGSSANPNNHTINFDLTGGGLGVDSFQVQQVTAPGVNPVAPTGAGLITFNGAAVANHSVPLETRSRALNTMNVEVQYSAAAAATDATKSGVAHFDSTAFTVDANGFVQLAGGIGPAVDGFTVDAFTGPGTQPVVPSGAGLVTVTGGQVATGIIGANVIRTNSLAANTYTTQIQQTATSAAKDTTKNGVAHFKSTDFTVDEGFVSLAGTIPVISTGTFTPTLKFGGSNTGMTTSSIDGTYYKIGNVVFYNFGMILSNKGSSTGTALFDGLPFTITTHTDGVFNFSLANVPANTFNIYNILFSATQLDPVYVATGSPTGGGTPLNDTFFNNNSQIRCWGTYFTS
jgi:hypothetical protein